MESATPMELLVIGKEDFNRIFIKAENPNEEADHVKFLRYSNTVFIVIKICFHYDLKY